MAWDDFGFYDGGGGNIDTSSIGNISGDWGFGGSANPIDYSGLSDYGGGASDPGASVVNTRFFAPQLGAPGAAAPGDSIPQPPGAMNIVAPNGGGGFGGIFSNPQNLLGLGGGLAGLLGTILNGGKGATSSPVLPTAAKAQIGQANQITQPGAQGQLPLQQMQMSLLQALASGEGLPPGYQQLVEQAFQPKLGSLYEQAANAGRARGFHDAPATAPPGGAVLGPGLADIQGQMAQAKLGLMQSLPGLYNTPIGQQIGAAGQQSQTLLNSANMERGQTTSQPIGGQIMNTIGAGLQGLGQSIGQQQKDQQAQQNFEKMISMSGAPQRFAEGGIVTKPTNAIIGEAGPEAVIPLKPSTPQPDPRSLAALFHLLGLLQTPERQKMPGTR